MKKGDKKLKFKKWYILIPILTFIVLLLFGYLKINLNTSPQISQNDNSKLKYNDPLTLSNLPKFYNPNTSIDFPSSEYEISEQNKVFLSIKNENYIDLGYLDTSAQYKSIDILPANAIDIKLFEGNKMLYVMESKNGSEPYLLFKNGQTHLEIMALAPNEFFTGYYYFPSEKVFYISKGNSLGKYTLLYLKSDGTQETLLESTQQIKIIKPRLQDAIIKLDGECKLFAYLDKSIIDVDCNTIYLNLDNFNVVLENNQIKLNLDGSYKTLYTAVSGDTISALTYFNNQIYFALNKATNSLISSTYKFLKVSLSGVVKEISAIPPQGEVRSLFEIGHPVTINKYFGFDLLQKFENNNVTSYPESEWEDILPFNSKSQNIELLGPDYQI